MEQVPGTSERLWLPISSVAEVLYCPRNFYLRVVETAQDANAAMVAGKQEEERRNERQAVLDREGWKLRAIPVSSERLGITGIVDTVRIAESIVPIEFKHGVWRDNSHDQVQVGAQVIALEEALGESVDSGYLYYVGSRKRVRIWVDDGLRDLVVATVEQARAILEARVIPEPVADRRCNGCSLFERCQPFEVGKLKGKRVSTDMTARTVPRMRLDRVLVLDQYGGTLKKSGQELVVQNGQTVVARIPAAQVDEVIVLGNVAITGAALRFLVESSKDLHVLSGQGRWLGTLKGMGSGNVMVRVGQFQAWQSPTRRLELARAIVSGKLHNLKVLLRRRGARSGEMDSLDQFARMARSAPSLDMLLGVEGAGSKAYFSSLKAMIGPEWAFEGRNRRPPRDPVNSLLSFGYALLAKDLAHIVSMVGLDPWLGIYHGIKYGRPAMALDLMEEFRPVIVDATVLTLINRRILVPDDFSREFGTVRLSENARHRFLEAYQARKEQMVRHPLFGYRVSYLRIVETQVRLLAKVLTGELDKYVPFRWR